MSQQTLLRETMESLDLTRNALAERLGVTRRALDTWLLPESSRERRAMPAVVTRLIETLTGAVGEGAPAAKPLRPRLTRPGKPHLLSVDAFDRDLAEELMRVADAMEPIARRRKVTRVLEGAVLGMHLFGPFLVSTCGIY